MEICERVDLKRIIEENDKTRQLFHKLLSTAEFYSDIKNFLDGEKIDDFEEEHRLFYVSMTRAMDILCLTHAEKRSRYGIRGKRERSCYIDDIEKKLTQVVKSRSFIKPVKKAEQMEMF